MTSGESELRGGSSSGLTAMGTKDIDCARCPSTQTMSSTSIWYHRFDTCAPPPCVRDLSTGSQQQGSIGQEIHELNVAADEQAAAAHMLIRSSGTLQDGRTVEYFVRGQQRL